MENCHVSMAGLFHSKYRASSCVKVPSSDENDGLLGSLLAITDDLASKYDSTSTLNPDELMEDAGQRVTYTLTPAEIQTYLSVSVGLEHYSSYSTVVGIIATRLIRNAIDNGEQDFCFDVTGLKSLHFFGDGLTPGKNGLARVVVNGTLGGNAFKNAQGNFYLDDLGDECFEFDLPHNLKSTAVIKKQPSPYLGPIGPNKPSSPVSTLCLWRPYGRNFKQIHYHQFRSEPRERFIYEMIIGSKRSYPNINGDNCIYPRSCEHLFADFRIFFRSTTLRMLSDAEFNRRWRPAARAFAKLDELLGSI